MVTKIATLEGMRKVKSIECSCGAKWEPSSDKAKSKRERQRFIAQHAEHDLKSVVHGSWTTTIG